MSEAPRVHLVPHTHWDREWYRPFQSFRMQLVDMIDRVLEMLDADPEFRFTLDGQLATVDDYLEIRPDGEARIRAHVQSGRLAIGPWLILMDEFCVSGENMVRNLERGWERAGDFGAPMRIGYLPDMFGHVAQMPQMLQRAGIDDAVVWRGVPAAVDDHQFRWFAPDGSAVRTEYLPSGYGNAAYLFAAPDHLDGRLARFREASRPFFGDDPLLAMYGTDHTAPVPDLARLVRALNELEADARIRISTLADYVDAAPPLGPDAVEWHGELRSGARANVLMGVASARIDLKAACGRAERILERFAEPLSSLWTPADAWPSAFLRLAWRRVIENSAHDSICGCSVDAVVDQVLVRFAEAEQIGSLLAGRAVAGIAALAPQGSVVALNPSPVARTDEIMFDSAVSDAWDAVALELPDGSRVATQLVAQAEPLLFSAEVRAGAFDGIWRRFHGREIFDRAWNGYAIDEVAGQPRITFDVDVLPDPPALDVDTLRAEVEAAIGADPNATWQVRVLARPRRRLLARVPVPPLGWTSTRPVDASVPADDPVIVDERGLHNGALRVSVAADGTLRLETADGTVTEGVGRILDGGDYGDSYNYGRPRDDREIETPDEVSVQVVEHGPLRAALLVTRSYQWPAGLSEDGAARSAQTYATAVAMRVELRSGEPFVRIAIDFDNRSVDHRVRFHVPTPRTADVSHAEGQFAVVERGMTGEGGYNEEPLATYPARGFVDAGGMAILFDHLAEYELLAPAAQPEQRELAITLLRASGLISRNDNPYREDPAGPEIEIPGAQCRGPWHIAFALLPHAGTWTEAGVLEAAERYQHRFLAAPGTARETTALDSDTGLEITGRGVVLSALHRREDGWLELRVVNETAEPVEATISGRLREAREASIIGQPGAPIGLDGERLRMALGAWEIRTVQVRREEPTMPVADIIDAVGPRLSR